MTIRGQLKAYERAVLNAKNPHIRELIQIEGSKLITQMLVALCEELDHASVNDAENLVLKEFNIGE